MRQSDAQRFMYRVDWNLFRQFHEIVQAGSISAAARRLNIHQPSLSAALKRLEDHLELQLCRRSAAGIELTPAGQALYQLTSEMLDSVRLVPHITSQAANRIAGTLSIWMISNVVSPELDASLQSFHARYPNVEIRIEIASWRKVLAGIVDMACDIGITHDCEPERDLQYIPLLRESQQLYCGLSHPLYGHRVRDPANLASEPLILTHGDEPGDLTAFRGRYGLGQRASGHVEDLHEAHRLISLGIGIGFLPTITPKSKDLWPILPPALLPSYVVYAIAASPARISTPTQLLLQELKRRLAARKDITPVRA